MTQVWKVAKRGNGGAFENKVKAAIASRRADKFPSKDNSQNSGEKKEVK